MAKIRKSAKRFVEIKGNTPEQLREKLDEVFEPHVDPLIQKVINAQQVHEVTDEEILPVDDAPRLTKDEMRELQLQNFALRCYSAERELVTMKRDEYLKLIDPAGKLREYAGTIQGLTAEHNTSMQTMNKLVNAIQTRLSIDLKKHTYNEESGILTKLED